MSELVEALKQRKVLTHLSLGAEEHQRWMLLSPEERDAIIAALEDRERLRAEMPKLLSVNPDGEILLKHSSVWLASELPAIAAALEHRDV